MATQARHCRLLANYPAPCFEPYPGMCIRSVFCEDLMPRNRCHNTSPKLDCPGLPGNFRFSIECSALTPQHEAIRCQGPLFCAFTKLAPRLTPRVRNASAIVSCESLSCYGACFPISGPPLSQMPCKPVPLGSVVSPWLTSKRKGSSHLGRLRTKRVGTHSFHI